VRDQRLQPVEWIENMEVRTNGRAVVSWQKLGNECGETLVKVKVYGSPVVEEREKEEGKDET